jgi:ABC-type multidrug transport system fused ATPase/permease subunit
MAINPLRKLRYIVRLALLAPYSKTILALQFLSGIFSFIGLPMLVPVLNYLGDAPTAHPEKYLGIVEKLLHLVGIAPSFHSILITAFVFIVLGNVLVTVSTLLAVYCLAEYARIFRKKIFEAYSKVGWLWLIDNRSGALHFAVMKEADRASQACLDAQRVIIYFVQIAVLIAVAVKISLTVTLMAMAVYGVLGLVNILSSRRIRRLGEEHGQYFLRLSNSMTTLQQNKKFFKTSLLNDQLLKPVVHLIDGLANAIKTENFVVQSYQMGSTVFAFMFLFVLMFFHKELSLGYSDLLLILAVFSRIAPNFNLFALSYATLDSCIPMYESLQQRLEDLARHQEENGTQVFDKYGPIRFEKVRFAYPNGREVFKNLNLTIRPHITTAFVGSSGVGKSTLLDLILGLLKPTEGRMLYDDIGHADLDKSSLRRITAYVAQDVTLIDGTLRENLAVRAGDVTEAKIQSILKKVGLDEVVAQMPQGLDTDIGENGVKLSGGQRQRVALARALFADPKILILDEATSALDAVSEAQIHETIRNLQKEFTIIIVSHKLSAVRLADEIFVLDEQGVCESGSYQELMDKKGKLHSFESLQRSP